MKTLKLSAGALATAAILLPAGAATADPPNCPPECGGPAVAHVGTFNGAKAKMPIYAQPSTKSAVIRYVRRGSKAYIICQTLGRRASGPYGTGRTWDKLQQGGYISDTRVYTGSDGLVAPAC